MVIGGGSSKLLLTAKFTVKLSEIYGGIYSTLTLPSPFTYYDYDIIITIVKRRGVEQKYIYIVYIVYNSCHAYKLLLCCVVVISACTSTSTPSPSPTPTPTSTSISRCFWRWIVIEILVFHPRYFQWMNIFGIKVGLY